MAPPDYNKFNLGKKYESKMGGGVKNMNLKFYINPCHQANGLQILLLEYPNPFSQPFRCPCITGDLDLSFRLSM